ncbi:MAG TPA: oligosaccharide flippase family protein [Thermoanaerobaculia bacterium]|nr:oligosaccharide flippase family protein [Thermoanaerobaculia bacterium]
MASGAGPGGAVKARPLSSGLLGGSALLLVTLNFANVLHFGFHIVMARMLGPAGYGALAALLAILYVLNVLSESAQTVLARYASREPDPGRLHDLLRRALRKGGQVTLILLAAYLAAAVPLSRWLRIPYPLMALFALSLVGVGLLPVHRGALQGWKRFGALGTNMILEGIAKLGIGVGLVLAGAGEYGAVAGVSLALCVAFVLSYLPLRDVFRTPASPAPAPDIYQYSLPVFVVTATVMGFYSLDVLLARAFFPDTAAGGYAVASFLGKSILLGTAPVTKAMFPISTAAAAQGRKGTRVLAGTLAILAVCVAPVLAAFAWIPETLVRAAGGPGYEAAAGFVLPLGIAMTLMSFSNALLLYRLSTGGLRGFGWLPLLVPLEAAALAMTRGSLTEFAWTVAAMNAVFLVAAGLLTLRPPRSPAPAALRSAAG